MCGPSGCGKSTVARAVLGLLPADARVKGYIEFAGEFLDPAGARIAALRGRRVSLLPQEPGLSLNPFLTVESQAAQICKAHAKGGADWLLALLDKLLNGKADTLMRRYPWELSGGERQRVALALALTHRPAILIADEPTTALDAIAQCELLDLLARLRTELGMALWLISHDAAVLRYAGARILDWPRSVTP